jgi:hypothetical protein
MIHLRIAWISACAEMTTDVCDGGQASGRGASAISLCRAFCPGVRRHAEAWNNSMGEQVPGRSLSDVGWRFSTQFWTSIGDIYYERL